MVAGNSAPAEALIADSTATGDARASGIPFPLLLRDGTRLSA